VAPTACTWSSSSGRIWPLLRASFAIYVSFFSLSLFSTRPPTARLHHLVWTMSASAYTTQATSTTSLSIDVAWAFDPSTAKPSDRFLIGVLIAIFVILGICMVFMIKRALLTAIRRLRDQGTAVNVAVERKIRRRRPRLFEVWIAEAQELWTGMQYDTTNTSCTWEGLQVCHGGGSCKLVVMY